MNDTDKRKTLYDEIFKNDKAPEVTTNNGNQEIKDAIDNKEFNNNDIVNLEDIFVFDDKDKNTIPAEIKADSEPKATSDNNYSDDKYNDLINNTLIDLKLDLENVSKESPELQNINLDNIIKKNDDIKHEENLETKAENHEAQNAAINSKMETESLLEKVINSKDDCQTRENSVIKTEINQDTKNTKIKKDTEDKKVKKSSGFWINYALVAALVMLAIVSSLAFLIRQFK